MDEIVRAAEAETSIRNVNELIMSVARDRFEALEGHVVCECSQPRCHEVVPITIEDYERVRAQGRRFVLIRGHELEPIERVVETYDGYVVAEKQGQAGHIADLNDPRRA
jgi:hypothetical protein